MIQAGQRYDDGEIIAALFTTSANGTTGIKISVRCSAGSVSRIWWFTHAALKVTAKMLAGFGVTRATCAYRDGPFWTRPGDFLVGKPCSFTTQENKKGYVEIEWLNPQVPPATEEGIAYAQDLMSQADDVIADAETILREAPPASVPVPARPSQPQPRDPIDDGFVATDDDVPF